MGAPKLVALLVAGASITIGIPGTSTVTARSGAPPPSVPDVPSGWTVLTDDTGLITVPVPPTWTDVITAPIVADDGRSPVPLIFAATDLRTLQQSFDAPGLMMLALPYNPSTDSTLLHYGLDGGCRHEVTEPYDDGAFSGAIRHHTECGIPVGSTEVFNLAVSPPDRSLTLALHIQITNPNDREIVDIILAWFNMTPRPAPTTLPPYRPRPGI